MAKRPEVVGLSEIAELTGKHPTTVKGWRYRGLLPDPLPGSVSGAPAYLRDEIERWWASYQPQRRGPDHGRRRPRETTT